MGDRLRVVVWATGWIGVESIKAIGRRDDLELVGVWVHSEAKVGLDAGEIAGIGPIGVVATDDADALIALAPDCVVYTASGPERDAAAVRDYVRLLNAGIDVVSVSTAGLVYPPAYDPGVRASLEAAAVSGGATFYNSGIEPGFAGDQFVLTMLTMSSTIRSVRAIEIFDYSGYPVHFMMFDVFGFGMPMDYDAIMGMPGVQAGTWGPPVRMIAAALGVELDRIEERYERRATDRQLTVAAGVIEPGTCGAVRLETIGIVDGREAIVIEHVNRMAPDLAPEWATARRDGTYRLVIEGTPNMDAEFTVGTPTTASEEGMVATTMRIVNAIPAVVAARPGLVSSLDLPLTLPVRPFRS